MGATTKAVRVAGLFLAYGLVGMGGDRVVALLAGVGADSAVHRTVSVTSAHVGGSDDCAYEARREVALAVDADRLLRVRAGSGSLRVEGRAGVGRVEVVARACASEAEALDDLRVTLEERGGAVELTAHYPRRSEGRSGAWSESWTARLDLTVVVPLGMPADLDDSSGSLEVSGTGALRIDDSSGAIRVADIAGSVEIDDGSGGIVVEEVDGDVRVDDGSGDIDIRGVRGDVRLRDGSGPIEVAEVTGSVEVGRDGSGSIDVRDVGGGFSVLADGSGSIRHSGVSGRVDVPRSKRER